MMNPEFGLFLGIITVFASMGAIFVFGILLIDYIRRRHTREGPDQ